MHFVSFTSVEDIAVGLNCTLRRAAVKLEIGALVNNDHIATIGSKKSNSASASFSNALELTLRGR